jgi:hypothetical protein
MKKSLLILIIILFTNVCFSQTIEETKEFISLKLFDLNTEESFEFHKQYLLIKEVHQKIDSNGKVNNDNEYRYTIIELKKIKSIKFDEYTAEIGGGKYTFKRIVIIIGDGFPICLEKNKDPYNLINSKIDLNKLRNKCSNPQRIIYKNSNVESEQKIIKAFKHLVKLYGGKIIDDLF